MEAVASAAAVLQLLGQAVSIVREAYEAHRAARAVPKTLRDTNTQLENLVDIMEEVMRSPHLHTPAIHSQVDQIHRVVQDLVPLLETMKGFQRRNRMYQNIYMLVRKTGDEGKLNAVLLRLDRAKQDLVIRIQLAQMGVSGNMATDVKRIEKQVQTGTGNKMRQFRLEGNRVSENSDQTNGILGFENTSPSTMAHIIDNTSLGGSRQNNLILAGPVSLKFLQGLEL
ncbi:hypothetical protein QBC47DRAFT_70408 [Echria macrotheca]|uniref:NACHT-NTPase and P-loop NTPases N-terminal domain-containing protein n=1 Tax=Echria macrotheca TaxID=438768 RepID=A0AAJ0B4I6_9PEZI|nr:hypothetical protein QBC47DRAFT_70408 [Echria macrotheca]